MAVSRQSAETTRHNRLAGLDDSGVAGVIDEGAGKTQSEYRHPEAGVAAAARISARHFEYPIYWGGARFWGMGAYPWNPTAADNILGCSLLS